MLSRDRGANYNEFGIPLSATCLGCCSGGPCILLLAGPRPEDTAHTRHTHGTHTAHTRHTHGTLKNMGIRAFKGLGLFNSFLTMHACTVIYSVPCVCRVCAVCVLRVCRVCAVCALLPAKR
jgi:hypothetical protein